MRLGFSTSKLPPFGTFKSKPIQESRSTVNPLRLRAGLRLVTPIVIFNTGYTDEKDVRPLPGEYAARDNGPINTRISPLIERVEQRLPYRSGCSAGGYSGVHLWNTVYYVKVDISLRDARDSSAK